MNHKYDFFFVINDYMVRKMNVLNCSFFKKIIHSGVFCVLVYTLGTGGMCLLAIV